MEQNKRHNKGGLNSLEQCFKECPEFYKYYKKLNRDNKKSNNERTNNKIYKNKKISEH